MLMLFISKILTHQVAELFESGKQQGAFAQTFREILRRMSRDDSHVTIKVRQSDFNESICVLTVFLI